MKKICVVTGSRAEYGLLRWVMDGIRSSQELNLQVIATGMHLSPEFGLTYLEIEKDGFQINRKLEMLLSSDTPAGITKSMGLGMIGFADVLTELKPDILLVLGDRYETLVAATAAMVALIPIAHISGGESTEGAFDEAFRHSITKMSHLHFVSTEDYRRRVIQLGEDPKRVFNVGAPSLESLLHLTLLEGAALKEAIGIGLGSRSLLITWHPVTLEPGKTREHFQLLVNVLEELENVKLLFTKANADNEGRVINQMINEYVVAHPENSVAHTSLGQLRYLSVLNQVSGVVGNSSSGIIEAPSFRTGTVNIGNRQRGLAKMRHGGCWVGGKSPVGVVHLYLGDRHQVWSIIKYSRDNTVRAQFDALERELLDRRVALAHHRLGGP